MEVPVLTPEQFKVVAVSNNANSFGLYGVIIMARTGKAYEIAVGSLYKPQRGQILNAYLNESGDLNNIEGISYEIPRELKTAPREVVEDVFNS